MEYYSPPQMQLRIAKQFKRRVKAVGEAPRADGIHPALSVNSALEVGGTASHHHHRWRILTTRFSQSAKWRQSCAGGGGGTTSPALGREVRGPRCGGRCARCPPRGPRDRLCPSGLSSQSPGSWMRTATGAQPWASPRNPPGAELGNWGASLFVFICLFVFVFNSLGEFNVHLEVTTRATKDGAHGCLACVFSQISMFIDRFMCRRVVGLCPVAVS